jgi:deoxycytidylate deaminase
MIIKDIIPLETMIEVVDLPLHQASKKLDKGVSKVRDSLIFHGLWRGGKVVHKVCPHCNESFSSLPSNKRIFCSNKCKHEYHAKDEKCNRSLTEKIFLPILKKEVNYCESSNLEKEWLLQVDSMPGIRDVKNCDFSIEYRDDHGKTRRYYPDFWVLFETGLQWIVEVKGVYSEIDLLKFKAAQEWCLENGCYYRIVTTGMVQRSSWASIYSHPKSITLFSKEATFMNHAVTWACLSPSPSRQVGCVIVSQDMREIFSFGFNGDEKGGSNLPLSYKPGCDGFLHAEDNAISKLSTKETAIMFLTDSPCPMCAKRIVNAGSIREVYYLRGYRDLTGIGTLVEHGIRVFKFEFVDPKGQVYSDDAAFQFLKPGGL